MSLTVISLPVFPVGPEAGAENPARAQTPDVDFSALLLMLFAPPKGIGEQQKALGSGTSEATVPTQAPGFPELGELPPRLNPLPPTLSLAEAGAVPSPDLLPAATAQEQGGDDSSSDLSLPFSLAVLQQLFDLGAVGQSDLREPGPALPQVDPGKGAVPAQQLGADARPDGLSPDLANGLAIGLNARSPAASLEGGLKGEGGQEALSLPFGLGTEEGFASETKGPEVSREEASGSARRAQPGPLPEGNRKEDVLSLVGQASPKALAAAEFEAPPQLPPGSVQSGFSSKDAAQDKEAGRVEFVENSEDIFSGPARPDPFDVEGQKAGTESGASFSESERPGHFAATLSGARQAGEQGVEKGAGLRHAPEIPAALSQGVVPTDLGQVHAGKSGPAGGSPVIDQVVGEIFAQVRENRGEASIRLDPPELGGLKIELQIDGDSVRARIIAESAHTGGLIRDHLPELRHALQGHQLDLTSITVDVGGRGEAGADLWRGFSHDSSQGQSGSFTGAQMGAEEKGASTKTNAVLSDGEGLSVWA